jgi:hypothetical protein
MQTVERHSDSDAFFETARFTFITVLRIDNALFGKKTLVKLFFENAPFEKTLLIKKV